MKHKIDLKENDLRIDHETREYGNGIKETAMFVSYHEAPREIVSLFKDRSGGFIVSSNLSLSTAEHPQKFKHYGPALKEYYRRIHKFLAYKFHDIFKF